MKTHKIKRLLVANRSEIACRIMRTAHEMGIETVAVYSDSDATAMHVAMATRAVPLGGRAPSESYLDIGKIVSAAVSAGADAVHPGYGFLSENARFAKAVIDAGLVFVGPSPECIEAMGDKIRARELAEKNGLPLVPSAALGTDDSANSREAETVGYPVLVKAAAGGGGRGMRSVARAEDLKEAVTAARREALSAFGDDRVYLEKLILEPRHIEVQVFGDGRGGAIHLGERECSIQRRHQKVIEEAPSPALTAALRKEMGAAAAKLAATISYAGAGTVEFIFDQSGAFYFLEMNTRLQVEHAVTEMITQTDLVRWQLECAMGGPLPEAPTARGHAIECRIYAEDPAAGYLPTSGRVLRVEHPAGPGVRVDTALYDGLQIPIEYDPMLAKLIAWGPDRKQAMQRITAALRSFAVLGFTTNTAFLADVIDDEAFASGRYSTATLADHFSTWKHSDKGRGELAASVFEIARAAGVGASRYNGASASAASTPWDTLGGWRLGVER